jgi:hypothetical protein
MERCGASETRNSAAVRNSAAEVAVVAICLKAWGRHSLNMQTADKLVNQVPAFTKSEVSIPRPQVPVTNPQPRPEEPSPQSHTSFP